MTVKDPIIGHEGARARLLDLQTRERFPAASLFYGVGGSGKKLVAFEHAARLLCEMPQNAEACGACASCKLLAGGHHPDLHVIAPQDTASIKTEQVEELKRKIAYPALMARNHVTILDGADLMTTVTANSLLKTLEEPKPGRIFILLTDRLHRVLITIRSRCARVFFSPLADADVRAIVQKNLADESFADDAVEFALRAFPGAPGLVVEALRSGVDPARLDQALDGFDEFAQMTAFAKGLSGDEIDLPLFLQALRRRWLDRTIAAGSDVSMRDLLLFDKITEAERRLERHIQKDFVIENLFLS